MAANVNSPLRRVARIGENARRSGREPITQRQQRQVAEFPIAYSVFKVCQEQLLLTAPISTILADDE